MPTFNFLKTSKINPSYRNRSIQGMFDIPITDLSEISFKGDIPIDNLKWNIGLIVGSSGSGKSQISNNIFSKDFNNSENIFWDNDKSLVDNFPDEFSINEIISSLTSVGLNESKVWIKPHGALSTGQKFRADLARIVCCNKKIVFDEFTSVVDRTVAKAASNSLQKYIRREDKQFIAVTCHFDVLEWLQPDWVYNTDTKIFEEKKNSNLKKKSTFTPLTEDIGLCLKTITI